MNFALITTVGLALANPIQAGLGVSPQENCKAVFSQVEVDAYEPEEVSGTLEPGKVFQGPAGISISATSSVLSEAKPVFIETIEASSISLPSDLEAVGPYFRIGTPLNSSFRSEQSGYGFKLDIPVPEGLTSADVTLYALSPAEAAFHSLETGLIWTPIIINREAPEYVRTFPRVLSPKSRTAVMVLVKLPKPLATPDDTSINLLTTWHSPEPEPMGHA